METNGKEYQIAFRNHEGYADPTAQAAIANVVRFKREKNRNDIADSRCNMLVKSLKHFIELAGFDLISRIELRDRTTGREYK